MKRSTMRLTVGMVAITLVIIVDVLLNRFVFPLMPKDWQDNLILATNVTAAVLTILACIITIGDFLNPKSSKNTSAIDRVRKMYSLCDTFGHELENITSEGIPTSDQDCAYTSLLTRRGKAESDLQELQTLSPQVESFVLSGGRIGELLAEISHHLGIFFLDIQNFCRQVGPIQNHSRLGIDPPKQMIEEYNQSVERVFYSGRDNAITTIKQPLIQLEQILEAYIRANTS